MVMRRQGEERQAAFWVEADVVSGPRHVFYDRLNALLAEADFDRRVEGLCEVFYAEGGRPSVPPGRYFRMLFVGYFEGLDSQRGICWRCEDSLSLQRFLRLDVAGGETVPDHSSLTRIGQRLPAAVYDQVFAIVLEICRQKRLLKEGEAITAGVDSTYLEANAAMKSIVRRDADGKPTGEDWNAYVRSLMVKAGEADKPEDPTDEDVRRFDRGRNGKKVSNAEWVSRSDPDAEITKLKDGRTHLAYKAEHVVDLQSEVILAAEVTSATDADSQTLCDSLAAATQNLERSGGSECIDEVAADKGYHSLAVLAECEESGTRTYIPERKPTTKRGQRKWTDKRREEEAAFANNHARMQRPKGKRYQKRRSERVERSFAHVCDSGGARRSWLRGLEKIRKRYRITAAARNLGLVLRHLIGAGTPRGLAGLTGAALARISAVWEALGATPDAADPVQKAVGAANPLRRLEYANFFTLIGRDAECHSRLLAG